MENNGLFEGARSQTRGVILWVIGLLVVNALG